MEQSLLEKLVKQINEKSEPKPPTATGLGNRRGWGTALLYDCVLSKKTIGVYCYKPYWPQRCAPAKLAEQIEPYCSARSPTHHVKFCLGLGSTAPFRDPPLISFAI